MATTKENILKSASVVLARNPSVTYADLAQQIGIGRATLYRHFAKREDLIKALMIFSLNEIDQVVQPLLAQSLTSEQYLYKMIEVLIPIGERFHFLSQADWDAWEDDDVKSIYLRQDQEFREVIDYMQKEGKIRTDMPPAWIGAVFNNLIFTASDTLRAGDIARNDAADLVYKTFLTGFGAQDASDNK